MQARLPLLQQRRDLLRLEPEGLTLEVAGQQQGAGHTERHRNQQIQREPAQIVHQLLGEGGLEEADGNDPDDPAAAIDDRSLAAGGYSQRSLLDPDVRFAGQHGFRAFVDFLADQRRIRMRIARPIGAGDDDEACPGGLAHALRQRLKRARWV